MKENPPFEVNTEQVNPLQKEFKVKKFQKAQKTFMKMSFEQLKILQAYWSSLETD